MTIMTNTQFAKKCVGVAENHTTLYVMGCFGAPLTKANKRVYAEIHEYNREHQSLIHRAKASTFGFDGVGFIKSILWGWKGDRNATNGGAKYASNGVPDMQADSMMIECKDKTTDFNNIEIGEVLWCSGHVGVYIGDGLAVECTPRWKNGVQITAVGNIGKKAGYNTRMWVTHGKLPYIDYGEEKKTEAVETVEKTTKKIKKSKKVETEEKTTEE